MNHSQDIIPEGIKTKNHPATNLQPPTSQLHNHKPTTSILRPNTSKYAFLLQQTLRRPSRRRNHHRRPPRRPQTSLPHQMLRLELFPLDSQPNSPLRAKWYVHLLVPSCWDRYVCAMNHADFFPQRTSYLVLHIVGHEFGGDMRDERTTRFDIFD